jgi:hypothetical protein
MIKLTNAQRGMLVAAMVRDDGAASMPGKASRAGAGKLAASLIARKLMREVKAKSGTPVWRTDESGKIFSLIITRAGRKAVDGIHCKGDDDRISRTQGISDKRRRGDDIPARNGPRVGTKQSLIVSMLLAEQGATLDALIDATGWLPHTTRAALTGLRKKGYAIESFRGEGEKASSYRIVGVDKEAA